MDCESGRVIWITGLSGAGKSTIACACADILRTRYSNVVVIDGDEFRAVMCDEFRGGTGYDRQSRLQNARRISRLCRMLSSQGIHVVCATMSLFHECHKWNREKLESYFEVYIRVPMPLLIARDPKGIYRRSIEEGQRDVVGMDQEFEEPLQPDMVIDNTLPSPDFSKVALRILRAARFAKLGDPETSRMNRAA